MSVLDYFQRTSKRDVVGIWDQNFNQFVPFSRPMSCRVTEPTKNMEHPIETGSVITDHRVILPVEIELSLIMDGAYYVDQYAQIKTAMIKAELFYVHTKTGAYKNMMITDIPHEETPENFDTIIMSLKLKEVILVSASYEPLPPRKVAQKTNSSTKDRGQVNGKDAPAAAQNAVQNDSALYALFRR